MKSRGTFVIVNKEARAKLGQQLNMPPSEYLPKERIEPMPKGRPNPLAFAQFWLGVRLEERDGAFYLDGRLAKLDQVMQAANHTARSNGYELLTANPNWVPS